MSDSSAMVTIKCPDHHQRLTNGLWNLYQTKDDRDSELTCGGQSIKAHGLVMQLFLSTNNFLPLQKDSEVVEMLTGGACMEKNTPSPQRVDERSEPVTKERKLSIPDHSSRASRGHLSTDSVGSKIHRTTVNKICRPAFVLEDGATVKVVNSDSDILVYRCSKCRTVFSSEAGMLAHVKKFRATEKCDNLLELVLEFMYKGAVTLSLEQLDDLQATAQQLNFQLLVDAVEEAKRCKPLYDVIPRAEHMLDMSLDGPQPAKSKCLSASPLESIRQRRKLPTEKPNTSQPNVCEDTENGDNQSGSFDFFVYYPDVLLSESDHPESWGTPSKLRRLDVAVQQKQSPEIVSEDELTNQQQASAREKGNSLPVIKCSMCEYTAHTRYNMPYHMKKHHPFEAAISNDNPLSHKCSLCSYTSPFLSSLIDHRGSVHSVDLEGNSLPTLKCYKCEYTTVMRSNLIRHIRSYHPEVTASSKKKIPFKCTLCDYKTPFSIAMKTHKMKVHPSDDKEIPVKVMECTKSEYSTSIRHDLSEPIRSNHPELIARNNNMSTGNFAHKCTMCDFKTQIASRLKMHEELSHSLDDKGNPLPVLECSMCQYSTTNRQCLLRHNKKAHSEFSSKRKTVHKDSAKPHAIKCKICRKVFESEESLEEHVTKHPMRKCTVCEYESRSPHDLLRHKRSSHPSTGGNKLTSALTCPYCDYLAKWSVYLSRHLVNIHADKMTEEYLSTHQFCPLCQRMFTSVDDLEKHTANHEIYKCNLCDYETKRRSQLPHHRKNVHSAYASGKPMIVHKCSECDFSTNGVGVLKRHKLALHSGLKPYKCPYCDYATGWSNHVNRHIKITHLNVKNHPCKICDFQGFCQANLKDHMNVHSGQRSFKCNSCEKSFFTKRTLQKHQKTHSTPRSHMCHLCGRAFKMARHLASHLKHVHRNNTIE